MSASARQVQQKAAAAAAAAEAEAARKVAAAEAAAKAKAEAAKVEAERVAAEAEKNAALMDELRARKQAREQQQRDDALLTAKRRESALQETRQEAVAQFQQGGDQGRGGAPAAGGCSLAVFAKLTMGDRRYHLETLDETSTVGAVKAAVEAAMAIPAAEQTLVVNGQLLKCDTSGLVQYVRPNTSEVCIMVLRKQ
jgi:hypothetical protein